MNWISVKKELPKEGRCLIFMNGWVLVGYCEPTGYWAVVNGLRTDPIGNQSLVTHWMPLPEPPEKK